MNSKSPSLWKQAIHEPDAILDRLERSKSRLSHAVLSSLFFLRVVLSEYWANHCITRASALAFTMLLTLIPLMASLSSMLASVVEVHPEEVESIVTLFLPFAPPTIMDQISNFFANAQKLRGIGAVILVLVAVGLFGSVEESLNTIWKVNKPRSLLNQLVTFTMVMVYGPLFFLASFQFRSSRWFGFLSDYFFPLDILPFLLVVLGFSMMIWLMPNTKVRFKSAFIGGLIAGALFELERWGFGTYIRLSIQTRTIYGAYGIFPFFLISLFFVAIFLLFGAEAAYAHQNFRPLLRAGRRKDRRVGDYKIYFCLRLLIDSIEAFTKRQPPPKLLDIMEKYQLSETQASGVLSSLESAGYLHAVDGRETFVPAFDISKMPIKDVLHRIEEENRKVSATPNDSTKSYLMELMGNMGERSHPTIDTLTFDELIQNLVPEEPQNTDDATSIPV